MGQRPASQHVSFEKSPPDRYSRSRLVMKQLVMKLSVLKSAACFALLPLMLVACSSGEAPRSEPGLLQNDTDPVAAIPDDGIDLSGDILVPPPPVALFITAEPGELVLRWQNQSDTIAASIDLFNTRTRSTTRLASNLAARQSEFRLPVIPHRFDWKASEFILSLCSESDCINSLNTSVATLRDNTVETVAATEGEAFDRFGASLTSAIEGRLLVAGAPGVDRIADNSTEQPDEIADAGAAELFFSVDGVWFQGAFLEPDNTIFNARFGESVASSADGNTIVVGAPGDSLAGSMAGSAYVFERTGETWRQSAELVPPSNQEFSRFGTQVAIDQQAGMIAVAAPGNPDLLAGDTGAGGVIASVTVYRLDDANDQWVVDELLLPPLLKNGTGFGTSLALSNDGETLAVTAPGYREATTALHPGNNQGAIFVYQAEADQFTLTDTLEPTGNVERNSIHALHHAMSIALDGNANTLVTAQQVLPAVSINRNEIVEKPLAQIVVYRRDADDVFSRSTTLTPGGSQSASTEVVLSISDDGQTIASTLLNRDTPNNTVTVFVLDSDPQVSGADLWRPLNFLNNPRAETANFGSSLEFSRDSNRLFVGADGGGPVFLY